MAEDRKDAEPRPHLEELNPEPPDVSPACCSAATLCTIASSVSHLAVTEHAAPDLAPSVSDLPPPLSDLPPSGSDQDISCCPRKRIRISDSGDSGHVDSLLQTHPPDVEPAMDTAARCQHPDHGTCVKSSHPFLGMRVAGSIGKSAHSLLETSHVVADTRNVKDRRQGTRPDTNKLQDGVSESDCQYTAPGLPISGGDAEKSKTAGDDDPRCGTEASKLGAVLSISPYHCHNVGGRLAAEQGGEQHSHVEGDGHDPLLEHGGQDSHECRGIDRDSAVTAPDSGRLATPPLLPEDVTGPAQCTASAVHSSLTLWSGDTDPATLPVDISNDTDTGSHNPQNTDYTQFQAMPGNSLNFFRPLPQWADFETGTSSSSLRLHHYDISGASSSREETSSLVASTRQDNKYCPSTLDADSETESVSLPTISAKLETDTSGVMASDLADDDTDLSAYSDTSSDAVSSSSESSPRQSSVASARDFHRKFQCSARESQTPGGVLKKTPRYGLKTDAVDDVIGVRRGGHNSKARCFLPSTSKSSSSSHMMENPGVSRYTVTIDDLPNDLLVHVFSFLPVITRIGRIRQVCKKWQAIVYDPALWRHLDLRNLPRLKDDVLLQLASLSDRVSALVLSDGRSTLLTDEGISRVLEKCRYLSKIKLNRCFFLSDDAFQNVGQHCQLVVYLNLSGCFTVTDKTLLAISKGCPLLEDLGLGQCNRITDQGLCEVVKSCPRLISLRLDQCGKLTNQALEALANHCPDLQFLHLLSCAVSDEGISHLSKLGKLRLLDISNVSQVSRRTVEAVVVCCPLLETLALSLNRTVDDQCLRQVVTSCPKLRCLSCVACGLSDQGLHHIAQHAKNLERLDVAWCADITDTGIMDISAACPKLRYLGIMRCPLISLATVERLLAEHPNVYYSNFELESRWLLSRAAEHNNS